MIDPGEDGPFRPTLNRLKKKIAQIFPTIGPAITTGFIRMYGK